MDENENTYDGNPQSDLKENKTWMVWLPALLIIGLVIGAAGVYIYQKSRFSPQPAVTDEPIQTIEEEEPAPESKSLLVGDNAIVVGDNIPGNTVSITSVTLAYPGYVVIHEDLNGEPGEVIGQSDLLEGTTGDLVVDINRNSVKGETLYAMLHKDDGNSKFDYPGDDGPVINENQDPIMMIFVVGEKATSGEVIY